MLSVRRSRNFGVPRGRAVLAGIAALGLGAGLLVAGGGAVSAEPSVQVRPANGSSTSTLAIIK